MQSAEQPGTQQPAPRRPSQAWEIRAAGLPCTDTFTAFGLDPAVSEQGREVGGRGEPGVHQQVGAESGTSAAAVESGFAAWPSKRGSFPPG